jgi:ParB family chromosome partitioning protein
MTRANKAEMIPIDRIKFLNPRARSPKKAAELMRSIGSAGLKKPITVTMGKHSGGDVTYDLVCGQGRVEAAKSLGCETIAAVIKDIPEIERYIMSLVENLARKRPPGVERLKEIREMQKRGMTPKEISKSTGLGIYYVIGYLKLLKANETGLVRSVENKTIPLEVAIKIARADSQSVQKALQDAYETGQLSASSLLVAKRLVEQRAAGNKDGKCPRRGKADVKSADDVVRAYKKEAERQKNLVRKNSVAETRLQCIVGALRELLTDDNFTNLLKAESLGTLPKVLADLLRRA